MLTLVVVIKPETTEHSYIKINILSVKTLEGSCHTAAANVCSNHMLNILINIIIKLINIYWDHDSTR